MVLLVVFLVVSIGFSFYCSVAEAVLLSISPSFIATLRKKKPQDAERLAGLKSNIDRPLAAILSLNTIAHTIGAAGVGAQAATIFPEYKHAVAIAGAVMTLLILVFSEIIPKTIGALYWRQLGPLVARTVGFLIMLLYPLVWLSEQLTKLLSGGKSHHTLSREELGAMAQIGAQQGVIDEGESRVFDALIRFPEITVGDVMTPRGVVVGFDQQTTVAEALASDRMALSRLPVFDGTLDRVTGFVIKVDLLLAASRGESDRTLAEFRREIATVRRDQRLPSLMQRLLENREHISMVVDRYGSVVGLVTLEDVVETLLGLEIVDEQDTEVDMQSLARQQWRKRAEDAGIDVQSIEPTETPPENS